MQHKKNHQNNLKIIWENNCCSVSNNSVVNLTQLVQHTKVWKYMAKILFIHCQTNYKPLVKLNITSNFVVDLTAQLQLGLSGCYNKNCLVLLDKCWDFLSPKLVWESPVLIKSIPKWLFIQIILKADLKKLNIGQLKYCGFYPELIKRLILCFI